MDWVSIGALLGTGCLCFAVFVFALVIGSFLFRSSRKKAPDLAGVAPAPARGAQVTARLTTMEASLPASPRAPAPGRPAGASPAASPVAAAAPAGPPAPSTSAPPASPPPAPAASARPAAPAAPAAPPSEVPTEPPPRPAVSVPPPPAPPRPTPAAGPPPLPPRPPPIPPSASPAQVVPPPPPVQVVARAAVPPPLPLELSDEVPQSEIATQIFDASRAPPDPSATGARPITRPPPPPPLADSGKPADGSGRAPVPRFESPKRTILPADGELPPPPAKKP